MRRTLCLLAFLLAPPCPADEPDSKRPAPRFVDQGSRDKRLAGYRVPEGFRLDILATPGVANPVDLTFDDDGTLFVLDSPSAPTDERRAVTFKYRDGSTRRVLLPASKQKDAVKILPYPQRKGVKETTRVVLEDDTLSALLLHDGWLYLAGGGTVRRCKPSRTGGPVQRMEVVAQGFFCRHLRGLRLAIGPEGWLYISAGAGDHHAEGSDGSRATVLGSGAVFRCRPDGSRLHAEGLRFSDPAADLAFDLGGNLFCLPGAFLYNDTHLPQGYRGELFSLDRTSRVIRVSTIEPAGAGFRLGGTADFLTDAKDDRFRPRRMVLGPDGAVYLVDARDKEGRIYRLTGSGPGKEEPALRGLDSWRKVITAADADLLKSLSAEDASDREKARHELVRRGERNRPALIKLLANENAQLVARIGAAGALASLYDDGVRKALLQALDASDDELRRFAAEVLGLCAKKGDRTVQDGLLGALSDESPAVRRALGLAMGRMAGPGAADSLATALSFDSGKDAFLREGLVRALEMLGKEGIRALLALADSGVQKETDRVVEAFLILRERPAFDALPTLLGHRHVGSGQRADLIRSVPHYRLDPPVSLEPIVAFVAGQKAETTEVKKALLDVLARPGPVRGEKAEKWLLSMLSDDTQELRRAAVVALGRTAGGACLAGRRFLDGKLPRDLKAEVAKVLRKHAAGDAEAAKLLAEVMK